MKGFTYLISSTTDIETLKSRLGQAFGELKTSSERVTADICDSFDWRLHHHGWQLLRQGSQFSMIHATTGRSIGSVDIGKKGAARFSWDFPASDVAEHLAPILEMRALIPMATIEKKVNRMAVCNADGKTIARLEVESLTLGGTTHNLSHCRLLPVKGYGRETRQIMDIVHDLQMAPLAIPAVVVLLRQGGLEPGAYSSKIDVALTPEMPAAEAVRLILKNLISVMHQNLEGVREDIDSEFLHDLRVAIRRARSLLGQTKGVFSAETTAALQSHLKTMGAVTGEVRDLDVYLLKKTAYVNQIPGILRPGVLQLFRVLQNKRRSARTRMVKAMAGAGFQSAMRVLDEFIQSKPMTHATHLAGIAPIGELAGTAITSRFRRVIKKGGRITAATPDERLHELRIECKKLRYLLEFFSSLYPADPMRSLVAQLKRLQDNLGDYNDLTVQQEFLARHLESVKPQAPNAVVLAAATGGLITRLAADQKRVRSDFFGVFEAFTSDENKARFNTLFA